MPNPDLDAAVARLTETVRAFHLAKKRLPMRDGTIDDIATLLIAAAWPTPPAPSGDAEFAAAAAFLRELQKHTKLTHSPGTLYTSGYSAGVDNTISCLEEPESARKWLQERTRRETEQVEEEKS